jgi:lipid-A-disaccharide synthase
MLEVADGYADDYQIVVAGAPSIDYGYYKQFTENHRVTVLPAGNTYHLLYNAKAALVTSGTATLETALFRVPQVVCYKLRMARFFGIMRKLLLKVRWVSLVNLIANREMVRELVADSFSVDALREELQAILSGERRERMLRDYEELHNILGNSHAPEEAAKLMTTLLNARH